VDFPAGQVGIPAVAAGWGAVDGCRRLGAVGHGRDPRGSGHDLAGDGNSRRRR
jgi:hypothetical protein